MAPNPSTEMRAMSLDLRFVRTAAYAAIGVVTLLAGCDRDTPTDVATPTVRASTMRGPSLGVSTAAKPTPGSTYEIKTANDPAVAAGNTVVLEVLCSTGKRALGGGFFIEGITIDGPDVAVYESSPRVTSTGATVGDGWRLVAMNRGVDTRPFTVYAICATI